MLYIFIFILSGFRINLSNRHKFRLQMTFFPTPKKYTLIFLFFFYVCVWFLEPHFLCCNIDAVLNMRMKKAVRTCLEILFHNNNFLCWCFFLAVRCDCCYKYFELFFTLLVCVGKIIFICVALQIHVLSCWNLWDFLKKLIF